MNMEDLARDIESGLPDQTINQRLQWRFITVGIPTLYGMLKAYRRLRPRSKFLLKQYTGASTALSVARYFAPSKKEAKLLEENKKIYRKTGKFIFSGKYIHKKMHKKRTQRRARASRAKFNSEIAKLKKDVRIIKKGIEVKYRDQTYSAADIQAVMTQQVLTGVVQATAVQSPDKRNGDKVLTKSVTVNGYINNNEGTPIDTLCRIWLVWVNDVSNSAVPASGLLRDTFSGTTYNIQSMRNLTETYNHKVLWTKQFNCRPLVGTLYPFKKTINLNKVSTFDTTDGDVTACEKGHLFMFMLSTQATGANCPHISFKWRHKFVDQ